MKTEHSKSIGIHQICRTKLKELLTSSLKDAPANVVARQGSVVVVRNHSMHCGPGCECHGCVNLPVHVDDNASDTHTESDSSSVNGSSTEEVSDSELEMEIVTNMDDMDEIFEDLI